MDAILQPGFGLRGRLTVPPDKAVCHRAVLVGAVAQGPTEIAPWPQADDCQQTLQLVRELGLNVSRSAHRVRLQGVGMDGLRAPSRELFCGESGTTLRLAAGLLAGQPFDSTLTAAPSLCRRPMRRIAEPLTQMGARIDGVAAAAAGELLPPLTIHGQRPLRAIRYPMAVASAQVKSAILLAGLFAEGCTTVIEQSRTRDHTERMLRHFGARLVQRNGEVSIEAGRLRSPGTLALPGDVSSAAFLIVAACCVPQSQIELTEVGLNPTRTGWLTVLQRMGAQVAIESTQDAWEPRGSLRAGSASLRATTVTAAEVPGLIDELPILMVAAACAKGTSRFEGLGELRVKETDRLRSMVSGLQRLGAAVRLTASDTVEIDGGPLKGGDVSAARDHRTAMSLAVAGLAAQGSPTTIRGADCVAKSYPEFFAQLGQLAGSSTVKTVDKA
jgi:3-phosphoshikimate 1-carboxyvinyltransferase